MDAWPCLSGVLKDLLTSDQTILCLLFQKLPNCLFDSTTVLRVLIRFNKLQTVIGPIYLIFPVVIRAMLFRNFKTSS